MNIASLSKVSLASGALSPVVLMVLALVGVLSVDFAIFAMSMGLAIALVPGIFQCYLTKTGWSKQSCVQTGSCLLCMSVLIFYLTLTSGAPLFLTGIGLAVQGMLWGILTVQAFKYKPRPTGGSPANILEELTKLMMAQNSDSLENLLDKVGLSNSDDEETGEDDGVEILPDWKRNEDDGLEGES